MTTSERTSIDVLEDQLLEDRYCAVESLAGSMSYMDEKQFWVAVSHIAGLQSAIAAVREVAEEIRNKLANPNRGCDVSGFPLDPNHPWHRQREKKPDSPDEVE